MKTKTKCIIHSASVEFYTFPSAGYYMSAWAFDWHLTLHFTFLATQLSLEIFLLFFVECDFIKVYYKFIRINIPSRNGCAVSENIWLTFLFIIIKLEWVEKVRKRGYVCVCAFVDNTMQKFDNAEKNTKQAFYNHFCLPYKTYPHASTVRNRRLYGVTY